MVFASGLYPSYRAVRSKRARLYTSMKSAVVKAGWWATTANWTAAAAPLGAFRPANQFRGLRQQAPEARIGRGAIDGMHPCE
jgi:hypothetical protein